MTAQLSRVEMDAVHADALKIISDIGIHSGFVGTIEAVTRKPGVSLRGSRICFDPALVTDILVEHRMVQPSVCPDLPASVTLRPYDYASYIVDPETDEIRPITQKDLVGMTRLVDALNSAGVPITGGCPGFAQDLQEPLRTINQFRTSVEYSRTGREADLLTTFEAEYIYRMHEVMEWLPLHFSLFMLSPLRVDDASLERILHFLKRGADIRVSVSAMPLLGATTPLGLRGALAQSVAEMLAGFTLMKLLAGDKVSGFSVKLFSFDMKQSNISLGSAEEALLSIICKEITEYYQIGRGVNAYIFSMGKVPGQQTAAEKMAQAIYKALAGVRTLTCGGATASTVFSPEQLIFDCEIVTYINRLLNGFQFEEEPFDLHSMQECIRENSYLGDENTVRKYRSVYWNPKIFEHIPYQSWREQELDQRQRVKKMIRELVDGHRYQLDPDRFHRIETIYKEAEAAIIKL